jgi:hypothetical protein
MLRSTLLNPLEAQYTAHRDAEKRRRETVKWLAEREREFGFDVPSVEPENEQLFLPGLAA